MSANDGRFDWDKATTEELLERLVSVSARTNLSTGKTDYVVSICLQPCLSNTDSRKVERTAELIRVRLASHFERRPKR